MSGERLRNVPGESKLVVGLVSGSEFINHMYLVLLPPILGLLAADFDVSLGMLGLAIGVQGLTTTVFQLPLGYVSDTYSRTMGFGLSLGFGSLGAFVTALAPTFPLLVLGQAILGIGIAGHHPSHYPLLSNAVSEDLRGRAFSIRGFAGALGFATPPALVTAVLALQGTTWRHALGVMAVIGAVYGGISFFLFRRYVGSDITLPDQPSNTAETAPPPLRARLVREILDLVSSPPVVALALLTFVMSVVSTGIRTYSVVHLTDGYGVPLDLANITLTAMFVVGAVMMLVGGYLADRFRPAAVLIGIYAVVGFLLIVFASLVVPVLVAMGVAVAVEGLRSSTSTPRDKLVDGFSTRANLGQSFAVVSVGMMVGITVAPPIFGALIDAIGLRFTFLTMAGVAFVALGLAIGIVATYDRLPFRRVVESVGD